MISLLLALTTVGPGTSYVSAPVAAPPASVIEAAPGYPIWLIDGWKMAKQPSGIAPIGIEQGRAGDTKSFLVADDRGELWALSVAGDPPRLSLSFILFEKPDANGNERKFDLEGVAVDPLTGFVYAVSEGKTSRVWKISLEEKFGERRAEFLEATPEPIEEILRDKVTDSNRGLEAIGVYGGRFYFGIEGGLGREAWLAIHDDTIGTTLHNVTKTLDMASLTDAVALADGALLLDRDRDQIVRVTVDDSGVITGHRKTRLRYQGPGGVDFNVHSAEGIAIDQAGDLWITIDPWKYFPASWENLSRDDRSNYRNLVPMLIRFRAADVARELGPRLNPWVAAQPEVSAPELLPRGQRRRFE